MKKVKNRVQRAMFKGLVTILLFVAAAGAFSTRPAEASWDWGAGFYLWALGMDGTLTVQGNPADVDIGFSDIWDNLDMALSAHVEGKPADGRFGFWVDFYGADLGNDIVTPPGTFDFKMAFVEAGGTFALGENTDVLYGLRYTTLDLVLEFDLGLEPPISPPSPILPSKVAGDQNWTDLMVGARWNKQFNKRWGFRARGDMAGFGISDSSDFTWNVQLLGTARFGKLIELLAGYRWYDVDYVDKDAGFAMDARLEGPVIALGFHW